LVWMAIFGLIGFVVGTIAQTTVDESVLKSLQANAPNQKPEQPTTAA
jgi:hypothetical protein